jgi:hypothetical protein
VPLPTPYSYRTYTGNGTTTTFSVPFPYIVKAHVKVYRNWSVDTGLFDAELLPGVGFNWASGTSISVTTAPTAPNTISVVRLTPVDQRVTQWQAGSPPTAFELTAADEQVLFVVQEFIDRVLATQGSLNFVISDGLTTVIDNLLSTSATSALSANQGRVLKGLVDALNTAVAGIIAGGGGGGGGSTVTVLDILTSTSVSAALSANMGRALKVLIDALTVRVTNAEAQNAALQQQINSGGAFGNSIAVSDPLTPVGTIVWLQRAESDPPAGWLYCNGINKQRNQYNALFNAIGTTYGAGDGTTTFGFPLEASLTNPFGNPNYNPFIKFGTRTSGPGTVFVTGGLAARFVDGTALGQTLTVNGGGFIAARNITSMSADASILVAARAVNTVQNIFAWKRNGLAYDPVALSNPLPTTENGAAASVTRDGRYLAFVAAGATNRDRVFIYKLNPAGTLFDLLTTVTYTALDADAHSVDWSPQGNYLGIGANQRGGIANGGRILSRSGDTFTVSGFSSTPDPFRINAFVFSPDGNTVVLPSSIGGGSGSVGVYTRAGSVWTYLGNLFGNAFQNQGRMAAWNADGSILAVYYDSGNTILFYSYNGSTFTQIYTSYAESSTANPCWLPGDPLRLYVPGSSNGFLVTLNGLGTVATRTGTIAFQDATEISIGSFPD